MNGLPRRACIDMGTNTALLLIADVGGPSDIRPVRQRQEIVRLGQGVDLSRRLHSDAMDRSLSALEAYGQEIERYGVEEVVLVGTSALRDAANREEFAGLIRERFGWELRVISGEEEARLTVLGVLSERRSHEDDRFTIIDIGGGSTEVIHARGREIVHSISLDVGSVRMTERRITHDPVTGAELDALSREVTAAIREVPRLSKDDEATGIGLAGTITTLARMDMQMERRDPGRFAGYVLTRAALERQIQVVAGRTVEARMQLPGLNPKRADVILAGAVILHELMEHLDLPEIEVSDRGLRFGALVT